MKLAVPKETAPGERRVALVPEVVPKLIAAGYEVALESGAGLEAGHRDAAYAEAGASVGPRKLLGQASIVLRVQPPEAQSVAELREGAIQISYLQPAFQGDIVDALARRRIAAFSVELLPRITRAQSMDVLSSQASIAGYKAVVLAASRLGKYFPMLTTAAGTVAPARVLVIGAGVAGLQAIATARRLGAVVEAYDVRPAARDEVRSLGATFVELPLESAEGEGGYAREQSEEYLRRQRELLAERVAAADVVITTAAIPGRRAPMIVTADMVRGMRAGSVIIDLAAETGGNCELTRAGEIIDEDGVSIEGAGNLAASVPFHASQLYSRNVTNLLLHIFAEGRSEPDMEDEITRATCVTRGGEILVGQPAASGARS